MARYTGKAMYIKWTYSGGDVPLDADFKALDVTGSVKKIDLTAGHDTHATYTPGVLDHVISLSALDVDTSQGTLVEAACKEGTEGTLEWGPLGTATGNPKHTVAAFVTSHKVSWKNDAETPVTIEWQTTEDITDATY